jgi:hypothetical protein
MNESVEHDTDGPLEVLARSIAAQTDALGHLRFKFEVQQMMLTGAGGTWVNETTSELEQAIEAVQDTDELFRASLAEAASSLGVSPESTLREVAAAAPEPWSYIFRQGREELKTAVERVGLLCGENRKLLARGYLATSAALAMLGIDSATSYDASGTPVISARSANILNTKA